MHGWCVLLCDWGGGGDILQTCELIGVGGDRLHAAEKRRGQEWGVRRGGGNSKLQTCELVAAGGDRLHAAGQRGGQGSLQAVVGQVEGAQAQVLDDLGRDVAADVVAG